MLSSVMPLCERSWGPCKASSMSGIGTLIVAVVPVLFEAESTLDLGDQILTIPEKVKPSLGSRVSRLTFLAREPRQYPRGGL